MILVAEINWQFTCTWSSLLSKNSRLQQIFVFYIPPSFHFQLWFEKLMAPLRSLLEIESAFDHIFSGYNRCNLAKASFQPEKATRLNLKFLRKFPCDGAGHYWTYLQPVLIWKFIKNWCLQCTCWKKLKSTKILLKNLFGHIWIQNSTLSKK